MRDRLAPPRSPETMVELKQGLPGVPMVVLGMPIEGTACTLFTGFGWMGAAQLHIKRCQQLLETGRCDMDPVLEGKSVLIEQDLYDELVADWAKKTGRPTR